LFLVTQIYMKSVVLFHFKNKKYQCLPKPKANKKAKIT
jgi:hypothetical protein